MNTFYVILLLGYAFGFVVLAFVPRWPWLIVASLAAGGICIWAYDDLSKADTIGAVFGLFVVMAAALGFASGFIARTIIIGARWSGRIVPQTVTLLATLVLVPALAYGLSSWRTSAQKARWAPPRGLSGISCMRP